MKNKNFWAEIRNDYFQTADDFLHNQGDILAAVSIDAWKTGVDDEEGAVIAKVILSKHGDILVDYRDYIATDDPMAQEAIEEAKEKLHEYWKEQGATPPGSQTDESDETTDKSTSVPIVEPEPQVSISARSTSMDLTPMIAMARLWGDHERRIYRDGIHSLMQGYDNMDLCRLLEGWAAEFSGKPEFEFVDDFFERKVRELYKDYSNRNCQQSTLKGNQAATPIPGGAKEESRKAVEASLLKKQQDLEYDACRFDIECYLKAQPEAYFAKRGVTLEQVLNNQELMDRLTHEHRKSVYDFGCDAEWSAKEACDCEPGIT